MLIWDEVQEANSGLFLSYEIVRRNGAVVTFEPKKIATAMVKACLTKEHLFALSKRVGAGFKLRGAQASGFFSASKANLRNAP